MNGNGCGKVPCCLNCKEFRIDDVNGMSIGGCTVMDLMGHDIIRPMESVCGFHRFE